MQMHTSIVVDLWHNICITVGQSCQNDQTLPNVTVTILIINDTSHTNKSS